MHPGRFGGARVDGSPDDLGGSLMRVLVTGFQPFGGEDDNPSWEVARRLPKSVLGAEVDCLEVPVVFGEGPRLVCAEADRLGADAVLCLGQAGGRAGITVEFVGINQEDASIPDNAGNQPVAFLIEPGGPDARFATVPVRRMVARMREGGVPASVSYSAGTYVCNDMLYEVLGHLGTGEGRALGGFVHLPYLPSQVTGKAPSTPSMSLDDMVRGVTLGLEEVVRAVETR